MIAQTGIEELDAITGGMNAEDLVIIAARPGMGKTELALKIAEGVASRVIPGSDVRRGVLIFSMEMSALQIAERSIANAGRMSVSVLRNPASMDDEGWARVANGMSQLADLDVWVVDASRLSVEEIRSTDSNGLPPHSISAIVDGGDVTEIAQTIRGSKGQGTATYGKTSVTVPDTYGNPHVISFSRSTDVPIFVAITLKVFTGYTSQIGEQIKQAVADYINGLTIGDDVLLSRIYSPANLGVVSGGNARYYDITDLLIGKSSGSVSASNIDIAYDASASCSTANISITVTS